MRKLSICIGAILALAAFCACGSTSDTADSGSPGDAAVEGDGGGDAGQDAGDCTSRLYDVERAIGKLAEEYQSCAVDTDCIAVLPDTKCVGMCGVAVAKSSQVAFDAAKTALGDQMCDSIWADCGQIRMSLCVGIAALCTASKCTAIQCDVFSQRFQAKADEIHARHSTCATSQDCDHVTFGQGCLKVNNVTVNASEKQAFIDEVSALEGEFCREGMCREVYYSQASDVTVQCTGGTCLWE